MDKKDAIENLFRLVSLPEKNTIPSKIAESMGFSIEEFRKLKDENMKFQFLSNYYDKNMQDKNKKIESFI